MEETLLEMIQAEQLCEEESSFGKNYSKTIVKVVFAVSFVVDGSEQSEMLIDTVLQTNLSGFKTQVALACNFRKNFGESTLDQLKQPIQQDEEMMQASLQVLRTACACKLILKALSRPY